MRKITPDEAEVRITDAYTGGQKGTKLARYDLIPVAPLEELAKVYGAGARKYEDRNWERGYAWSLSYSALQRHLNAFWAGEDIDAETNRHHLGAVVFHAFALMEMQYRDSGTDDRPPSIEEADQEAWNTYYDGGERTYLERTDVANEHFHWTYPKETP